MDAFLELSIVVGVALGVSIIMQLLRQPMVVGYIITGIIVGPYAFHVVKSTESIELFSQLGITTLLFIVGLSLNPNILREVGKVSFIVGLGQAVATAVLGYGASIMLGFPPITSMYIAAALTFSSTIIVLKFLTDRGDLNRLYAKIAIGLLLVQDLIATIILILITTLSAASGVESGGGAVLTLLLEGTFLTAGVLLVGRYVLPKFSTFLASSQELLFVFAMAWGLGLAGFFAEVGLSLEIGALISGIALSVSPFSYEVASRLKPVRDFFLLMFFVLLGYQTGLSDVRALLVPGVLLSIFVLALKPLIVLFFMHFMRYKSRVGLQSGLALAQISEFSLVLMALGLSLGHVGPDAVVLVTIVGIISITGSTYLIQYSERVYHVVSNILRRLDIKKGFHSGKNSDDVYDAIIFGYDRVGTDLEEAIKTLHASYLVVDFDPTSIHKLEKKDVPHRYGDAEDIEFLREINIHAAKLIVSSIPIYMTNLLLVKEYRQKNETGIIIVLSHNIAQTKELYLAGASYVIMPHYLGAHHASAIIEKHGFSALEFERERNHHLSRLAKRDSE